MAACDAESDGGVPALDRSDLTAEEQTEVLALMVARRKRQQEAEMRASDSSVRIAGEKDAASVRSAGSTVERFSEVMSFKTAAGSVLSSMERRQQRE